MFSTGAAGVGAGRKERSTASRRSARTYSQCGRPPGRSLCSGIASAAWSPLRRLSDHPSSRASPCTSPASRSAVPYALRGFRLPAVAQRRRPKGCVRVLRARQWLQPALADAALVRASHPARRRSRRPLGADRAATRVEPRRARATRTPRNPRSGSLPLDRRHGDAARRKQEPRLRDHGTSSRRSPT